MVTLNLGLLFIWRLRWGNESPNRFSKSSKFHFVRHALSLVTHDILDLASKDQHTLTRDGLGSTFDSLYSNTKELIKHNDCMNYLDVDPQIVGSYTSALNEPNKLKTMLNDTKRVLEKNEDNSWISLVLKLVKVYIK
ncbi:hypothetical protein BDC45DRAFT_499801 [Circinella umbellata]|nr:hypothetical protein BDC45DRAFT_499801 [Circinella umbellata]